MDVPEVSEAQDILQRMLKDKKLKLSKRKYCEESQQDEDAEFNSIDDIIDRLKEDACHGRDFNQLLWDYATLSDTWSDMGQPFIYTQFAISDSGVLLVDSLKKYVACFSKN